MPFDNNEISHIFQTQQDPAFYSLLDSLPDLTIIADEHGVIVFANAQALPVIGYLPSEIVGLNIEWLLPERYREIHPNHCQSYFTNPRLRPMGAGLNLYAQRKDGSEFPVEISLNPLETDQGRLVICSIRDISEQKKIETALQGDERFRLLLQYAPSSVAMFDRQMHYLAVSTRWLEDYRLNDKNIIGTSHYDVFPDIPDRWKKIHQRCLAGEALEADEELFLRADGQQDWVNWKMHPWHTADGEIGGAILFTEVITKRKQIEQAMSKSDELFREIFENAVTGITITDSTGSLKLCNPAYCNLLGYSQKELAQINFSSLIHPDDREADSARIRLLLAEELSNFEIENRYLSKSGNIIWIRKFVSTLTDETGSHSNILALFTDITDRKRNQEALVDSHAFTVSILNSLTPHIAVLDAQGVIVAVNNAWQQFAEENGLLASCQGLLGANYLEACKNAKNQPDSEDANASYNGIVAVLAGERKTFQLEYPRHSPHQQRWFKMNVSPLQGSRRGVVVSHEDITRRKQAQQQLQDSEQMLSESQRIAHIGSWAMEVAPGHLSWSDEMYRIYGVTRETFEPTLEALIALIHPEDQAAMNMWVSDCLTGKKMPELDFRIMLSDGSLRFIHGSGGLQHDDMNRPLRMVGSAQDITERIHREQQDHAHLEQLAHVTRLGLMGEMAAGIAHEVNQPLSAISIYTQVSLVLLCQIT